MTSDNTRPNIMVICLDDAFNYWRFRDAFGVKLQTPNLDRICERATAFQAAYCQAPVCGPSRSSFMSGLAPHQTGIFDNYSEIFDLLRPDQMWSYRLKENGYYCSTAGKLHHGYMPRPDAVHNTLYSHESYACRFGPKSSAPNKNYGGGGKGIGTTNPADDRKYYDHFSSEDAIRFLDRYDDTMPFYREVGFHNPHPPFKTPARFKEMYDENDFIMPEEWAHNQNSDIFADKSFPENMNLENDVFWRRSVRNYFSGFSHADWHIGRVWDALQASPHADDTVVIIVADHGYHMGDKGRFRKYTLWEEAASIPMIIYDPRQNTGQVIQDPVALLDLGQTVMDYANLPPLTSSPGKSLRPQVQGEHVEGRAVPTFWFGSSAIRRGNYRFISYQDGSEQLFDVIEDPWQLRNIVEGHSEAPTLRKELQKASEAYGLSRLKEEQSKAGQPTDYISIVEGGSQPIHPPTLGQFGFEPPSAQTLDVPGWRRYFVRPRQDMLIDMPNAWREIFYAGDIGDGAEELKVQCNDLGCHIDFMGGHKRLNLTVVGGRGDDRIETAHEPLTAFLTAGNNSVEAGFSDAIIYGGSGHDHIECQRATNKINGGTGNADIMCGIGHDVIRTGSGLNKIVGSTGTAKIIVTGGENQIKIGSGDTQLKFLRTGLPQKVEGYKGGSLDLADLRIAGHPHIETNGDDVILTCGIERVRFIAADIETVRTAVFA